MNIFTRLTLVLVLVSGLLTGCKPAGPGSVSGQVKFVGPDGAVQNLVGAQVVLRGARDTFTTVTSAGEGSEADAGYNYRFEKLTPGRYILAVTPPGGAGLQPEDDIPLDVKADELYPQSVLLLPEGMAKPRALDRSEMGDGETGYTNGRGDRVVYRSGPDMTDFLLLYLLFRNPVGYGYGAPPVIVNSPGSSTGGRPSYRVDAPPKTSSNGQTITQSPAPVPGQGATRPGAAPASAPSGAPRSSSPSNGQVSSSSSSSPSQGVSRPSTSTSSSSSSSPSRSSSSGGRK